MLLINNRHKRTKQLGLSLVELLVALVIGLLVTLVITQTLSIFEGQKRSTSGTSDAQTNGMLSLFAIQREAQMGGYGLPLVEASFNPLKCNAFSPANVDLSMVTLTDGGTAAGNSDRISINYGDSPYAGMPVSKRPGAQVDQVLSVKMACSTGEDALTITGANCVLQDKDDIVVPPGETTKISCLGTWQQVAFFLNGTDLVRQVTERQGTEMSQGPETPISTNIVAIKAQYGVSADTTTNTVSQWVRPTGTWAAANLKIDPDSRNRIKAVRIAVVARNNLLEKENVTVACSSLIAQNPTGLCTWEGSALSPAPALDLTDTTDWQRYRYRVFETIIPLRNMIWSQGML